MDEAERYSVGLAEMLRSDGWESAQRALRRRQQRTARHLALGKRMEEGEMREQQARYLLIEELLQDPYKFFSVGEVDS